jgi:hypothetical protein
VECCQVHARACWKKFKIHTFSLNSLEPNFFKWKSVCSPTGKLLLYVFALAHIHVTELPRNSQRSIMFIVYVPKSIKSLIIFSSLRKFCPLFPSFYVSLNLLLCLQIQTHIWPTVPEVIAMIWTFSFPLMPKICPRYVCHVTGKYPKNVSKCDGCSKLFPKNLLGQGSDGGRWNPS